LKSQNSSWRAGGSRQTSHSFSRARIAVYGRCCVVLSVVIPRPPRPRRFPGNFRDDDGGSPTWYPLFGAPSESTQQTCLIVDLADALSQTRDIDRTSRTNFSASQRVLAACRHGCPRTRRQDQAGLPASKWVPPRKCLRKTTTDLAPVGGHVAESVHSDLLPHFNWQRVTIGRWASCRATGWRWSHPAGSSYCQPGPPRALRSRSECLWGFEGRPALRRRCLRARRRRGPASGFCRRS